MTPAEQGDYSWNDLVQKATAQGLAAGSTKIPKEIIGKVLDNEDPWSKTETLAKVDIVDTEKDGVTKEEYLAYRNYEMRVQTPSADGSVKMCTAKFAKWASAQESDQAFATCNAVTAITECNNACEPFKPQFNPENDWKNLLGKLNKPGDSQSLTSADYLQAAKDLWPHLVTKMEGWVAEFAKDGQISREEFSKVRTWVHKVSEYGCVLGFDQFELKQTDVKNQFVENSACKVHPTATACAAPCFWQGEPPATGGTDPVVFDCTKGTTAATCPTDKCNWDAATAKCFAQTTTNPTQPTGDHCS